MGRTGCPRHRGFGFGLYGPATAMSGFGLRVEGSGWRVWISWIRAVGLALGVWASAFKALRLGSVRLPLDDHLVVLFDFVAWRLGHLHRADRTKNMPADLNPKTLRKAR